MKLFLLEFLLKFVIGSALLVLMLTSLYLLSFIRFLHWF